MPPTRTAARQAHATATGSSSSQPNTRTSAAASNSSGRHQRQHQQQQQQQAASQPLPTSHQPYHPLIVPGPDDSDFLDSEADLLDDDTDGLGDDIDQLSAHRGQSSRTTASVSDECPMPVRPLVHIGPRIYFAVFPHPAPDMTELSHGDGSRSVILPPADAQELEQQGHRRIVQDGTAPLHKPKLKHWEWLIVDNDLPYLSFFDDWGPLNIGMLWRFCTHIHQWLMDPDCAHKNLVVYTSNDPHKKANAALLMALWALVIEKVDPADAFFPFSTWEFEPFRDAGYGRADFNLSIQDCIYGLHRGLACGLLDLSKFDIDEYEYYEQVQNGDWNWITPNFIAFASPNDKEYVAQLRANALAQQEGRAGAVMSSFKLKRPMSKLMTDTIKYFRKNSVKLVVRLNNPLYDKKVFEDAGISHVDMYFDDGSNPSTEILQDFIRRADEVITAGGVVAVHCKAGLGRTGVLIGAYLIWRHGFTANEIIGFMRLMRPGCVVGPQQHFMYVQFVEWIRWGERARIEAEANGKAKLEEEKKRIEDELAQSRREVEEVKRQLAEAQSKAKGGVQSAKADEAARMRLKRKSSSDRDPAADDWDDSHGKEANDSADGPVTPRPHKVAHFAAEAQEEGAVEAEEDAQAYDEARLQRTAPMFKPPPVVGQPRKSPSPSRKRTMQMQAPATEGRLGSRFGRSLVAGLLGMGAGGGGGGREDPAHSGSSSDSAMADGETPTHSPALDRKIKRSGGGGSGSAVAPVRTSSLLCKNELVEGFDGDADMQPVNGEQLSTAPTEKPTGGENADVGGSQGRAKSSSKSGTVQPLMQSIHAGNVQLDHQDTVIAARSMLTQDGKLALSLSPKEATIGAYVRTGGMTSPSLKSIGSATPGGSTTPKGPPPLPTPSNSRSSGVLARLNGHARTQSAVTSASASGLGAATGAPPSSTRTLPLADDVFSSPPLAASTSSEGPALQAIPPLFRASPEVRDRFGLRDSRLPTPNRERERTSGTPVTSPKLETAQDGVELGRDAAAKPVHVQPELASVAAPMPAVSASTSEVRVVSTRTRPAPVSTRETRSHAGPYVRPDGVRKTAGTVSAAAAAAAATSSAAAAGAVRNTRSASGQRQGTGSNVGASSRPRVPSGSRTREVTTTTTTTSTTVRKTSSSSSGQSRTTSRTASGSSSGGAGASRRAVATSTTASRSATSRSAAGTATSSSARSASNSSSTTTTNSSSSAAAAQGGPAHKRPRILATTTNEVDPLLLSASTNPDALPVSIDGRVRIAMAMSAGCPAPSSSQGSEGKAGAAGAAAGVGSARGGLQRNVRPRRSSLGEADVDVQA
ncbi:cell division control protein 14 [Tilletia horrida]|nr:cell division control protein 14 [Tilletia horrida]